MAELSAIAFAGIDEGALGAIALELAPAVVVGGVIHLIGALGAGKTTFARALLGAIGVEARIKSPTYSLIESYKVGDLAIQHLDLYRIAAAEEMEWLGLRDLATARTLWLIEWPERAPRAIPAADLRVQLAHATTGRDLRLQAVTPVACGWLNWLQSAEIEPAYTTG